MHVVTGSFAILSRPSFDFYLPQCTKACSFSSRHGGRCHCGHEVSHAIDIQSGIFSLCSASLKITYLFEVDQLNINTRLRLIYWIKAFDGFSIIFCNLYFKFCRTSAILSQSQVENIETAFLKIYQSSIWGFKSYLLLPLNLLPASNSWVRKS